MSAPGGFARASETRGLLYAIAAYGWWGLVPIFWKHLTHVPAAEIIAHRIVWAFLIFAGLLVARRQGPDLIAGARRQRALPLFALSSALIACNWLTFVYAMATARVLEASLGYFLNPIVSVVLGMLVMGERLRRAQWSAVGLGTLGVAQLAAQAHTLPWISLVLACSFGLYGLIRKTAPMAALPGSTLETGFALPVAALYLAFLWTTGAAHFGRLDPTTDLLLVSTGVITAAPLLWFSGAARRLPLSTLGFVQYLAPTGQFLLAVFLYGEPFTTVHLRSFACIWTGIAIYSVDSWRHGTTAGRNAPHPTRRW